MSEIPPTAPYHHALVERHESGDVFSIPPPPPVPSHDAGLHIPTQGEDSTVPPPSPNSLNVFTLNAVNALKFLCAGIEALVKITGDIPPTPPPTSPIAHNMLGMAAEKENISRSNSMTDFASLHGPRTRDLSNSSESGASVSSEIDGVELKKNVSRKSSNGGPRLTSQRPYVIIGENAEPLNVQHNAIARKFYSKHPPPISLEDYLMRIHQFCPMSTAVYLATSFYIHKLAVDERAIPVTRRNCHRLVLAGLRVAMKALEDLSYPHSRFAKVGGVSESELARLEISFCFLMNFEFKTNEEILLNHAISLREISSLQGAMNFVPRLPLRSKKRTGRKDIVNI